MPSELHLQRTWTGTHGAEKAESRRPRQAPCPLGGPRHWAWVCSTRPSASQSQRWDVPAHPDPVRSQAVTPRRETQCGAARGFPGTPPVSMGVCKPVAQPREAASTSTPRRPFGAHAAQGRRLAHLPKVPTGAGHRGRSQRRRLGAPARAGSQGHHEGGGGCRGRPWKRLRSRGGPVGQGLRLRVRSIFPCPGPPAPGAGHTGRLRASERLPESSRRQAGKAQAAGSV